MRYLALRFILKSGAFIHSGPLSEPDAREKVRLILTGEYKLRNILRFGDHTHPEGAWSVSCDDIAAVHTFDPMQMQSPQMPQQQTVSTSPWFAHGDSKYLRSGA